MEANDQALPADAPTDTGCPDLEDIAAFLDGTLPAERRASMIEHLASCESCYELFAGAARFQADELQAEALREPQQPPQGDVGLAKGRADRPFERPDQGHVGLAKGRADRWPARSRAWRRGAAAAIAALLVASLAPLLVWQLRSAGGTSPEGLSADLLKSPAAMKEEPWQGRVMRGPADHGPEVSPDLEDFRLGVRLLDLRLALAGGNKEAAEETLRRLDNLFGALFMPLPEISSGYQGIRAQLDRGTPPAALLPKAEAEEKRLFAAGIESESVELGSWTEACRRAGAARQPEIFRSRAVRRLLERAQAPSTETLGGSTTGGGPDQRPAEILREIKAAVGAKQLDFGALARQCKDLLEVLDSD